MTEDDLKRRRSNLRMAISLNESMLQRGRLTEEREREIRDRIESLRKSLAQTWKRDAEG